MDFALSPRAQDYLARMQEFMDDEVYPAESVYARQREELIASGQPHVLPQVVEELKASARSRGLWNLFLPDATDPAHGLTPALTQRKRAAQQQGAGQLEVVAALLMLHATVEKSSRSRRVQAEQATHPQRHAELSAKVDSGAGGTLDSSPPCSSRARVSLSSASSGRPTVFSVFAQLMRRVPSSIEASAPMR